MPVSQDIDFPDPAKRVTPLFNLAAVVEAIKQKQGSQAIADFRGGHIQWPAFPFMLSALDRATLINGVPRGRIVEIFGEEHVGKTTLCMRLAAAVQSQGIPVLWQDYEHALDVNFAQRMGVSFHEQFMAFCQPESLEEGCALIEMALQGGFPGLIVVDSVPAMQPTEILSAAIDDTDRIAAKANALSRALVRIIRPLAATWATIVYVNQLRTKIGAMVSKFTPEFEKYTTTGGLALKFYASMRLHMKLKHTESWEKKHQRSHILVTTIKNKLGCPYQECELVLYPGQGFAG